MKYTALLVAALLLAAPSAVSAQSASPEALAMAVNQAVSGRDWKAFVALIHRPDLERVHDVFGRVLDIAPEPELLSAFGVADAAAFRALEPEAVMLSFLDLAQVTQQLDGVEFVDTRVVGVVYEAPDHAHAVIRQTMQLIDIGGGELSVADVISMRRRDDGWYMLMAPELEGLLVGIESGMATGGG